MKSPLIRPPFAGLERFARLFFTKRTFDNVIGPRIADAYYEYCEALAAGQTRRATWLRIRDGFGIVATMAMQVPVSVGKLFVQLWKAGGA